MNIGNVVNNQYKGNVFLQTRHNDTSKNQNQKNNNVNNKDDKNKAKNIAFTNPNTKQSKMAEIAEAFQKRKDQVQEQIESVRESLAKVNKTLNPGTHDALVDRMKSLYDKIKDIDTELSEALKTEQQRVLEEQQNEEKKKIEKATEERERKKAENADPEELKNKEAKDFASFVSKTDSTLKHISNSKQTKAVLAEQETRLKIELANDSTFSKFQEQRIKASKSASEHDGVSHVPWIPNTSSISARKRIELGKFTVDEFKKAEGIKKLQAAMKRTDSKIAEQVGDLNKLVDNKIEQAKKDNELGIPDKKDKAEDTATGEVTTTVSDVATTTETTDSNTETTSSENNTEKITEKE